MRGPVTRRPERATIFPALDLCPGCGSGGLVVSAEGDLVVFRCRACAVSWHVELGYVVALAPELVHSASDERAPVEGTGRSRARSGNDG